MHLRSIEHVFGGTKPPFGLYCALKNFSYVSSQTTSQKHTYGRAICHYPHFTRILDVSSVVNTASIVAPRTKLSVIGARGVFKGVAVKSDSGLDYILARNDVDSVEGDCAFKIPAVL
ncbi:hypothetical protein DL96DRAFT_1721342 [Flagelloscypha sp. PMI_526]|nr:hypothetical protein DL96DRAFT_1721342 [Flagelloscypha sp. PMI_526]